MFEDRRLVEFSQETSNKSYQVGDIYLGKVKKVIPGLNACFVDIGYEKDAFLHYLDLGSQFTTLRKFTDDTISGKRKSALLHNLRPDPDITKDGKIADTITKGQILMVQVVKEPISTKGPRLSSELSIAGRYCVLVPFSDTVSISKKVSDLSEKKRLKQIALGVKPKNFGVIVRTAAIGCEAEELENDIKELVIKWEAAIALLKTAKPTDRLVQEVARTTSMLRDLLNDSFQNIYLDDPRMHEEVKDYVASIAPEKEEIVKLYKGKQSLFEHFNVDKQVMGAFGKNVTMPGGSYIIIEHTEALHVIDVNSGNRMKQEDQENNALNTNLEAADEIARQLRLRDMGGIIVIDFIDMRKAANKKLVYERMRDAMQSDRAKHTVLPISKFGLLQITRQRVRPEVTVVTNEQCPMCEGTGAIRPSILLSDEIEAHLKYIFNEQNEPSVSIHMHPFIASYFTAGLPSKQMKWWLKYKKWVRIYAQSTYHMGEYQFYNKGGEQINF